MGKNSISRLAFTENLASAGSSLLWTTVVRIRHVGTSMFLARHSGSDGEGSLCLIPVVDGPRALWELQPMANKSGDSSSPNSGSLLWLRSRDTHRYLTSVPSKSQASAAGSDTTATAADLPEGTATLRSTMLRSDTLQISLVPMDVAREVARTRKRSKIVQRCLAAVVANTRIQQRLPVPDVSSQEETSLSAMLAAANEMMFDIAASCTVSGGNRSGNAITGAPVKWCQFLLRQMGVLDLAKQVENAPKYEFNFNLHPLPSPRKKKRRG